MYPHTDLFLLAFSVADPVSFSLVRAKWWPEIRRHCPSAAVVLVGTKVDLRGSGRPLVSAGEGERLAAEIQAAHYLECSALTRTGLMELFDTAIKTALYHRHHTPNKHCNLL
eukprot:TRINITY_DN14604_c0_g1_i2.p1 TRINITY_DN14604_c0_g1~~TRINITY_DN14604_c0_g1_i2.p1  ORF type:complete len:112 (+),score=14.68 TRINITY_DN14604_c0_g1_i2:239-574(+)